MPNIGDHVIFHSYSLETEVEGIIIEASSNNEYYIEYSFYDDFDDEYCTDCEWVTEDNIISFIDSKKPKAKKPITDFWKRVGI